MLKEYSQAFGKTPTQYAERSAFINRADYLLAELRAKVGDYSSFFEAICFELGLRAIDWRTQYPSDGSPYMNLGILSARGFDSMVEILMATSKITKHAYPALFIELDKGIEVIMDRASLALGISYKDGMFYPSGEPALDQDLINHSLTVLSPYPAEDKDLRLALDNYRAGRKDGIAETCYRCIEGLTRKVLDNNNTIVDNKAELLKRLNLTDDWRKILAAYIKFGNEYGRHASEGRHNASEEEVEAYLYQTCLLIRLIVKISK